MAAGWRGCLAVVGKGSVLKQPRRRRQQKLHKFAYLTMKSNSFARFARAFFIFLHFVDVLVLFRREMTCFAVNVWTTWAYDVLLSQKRWFQFNSRIVRTHFASVMPLNNCEIIAETRSYIFRWRSRCGRHRLCLSSLMYYPGPSCSNDG